MNRIHNILTNSKKVQINRVFSIFLVISFLLIPRNEVIAQSIGSIETKNILFESEGINLVGTIYTPKKPFASLVIVHGSDPVPRMVKFAELLAKNDILVLTYDKRGVAESGGVYVGPQVGTNNISMDNLDLLAKDASAAVNIIHKENINIPVGVIGFSQAGWIMPKAANKNPLIEFMVLFSCPTITTLEQLRFQFYTNGRNDFWDNHTEEDAREHTNNDPDRYQFTATDPKLALSTLSTPGLWLFGEKDIQIPAKVCIDHLNTLKAQGKPFEYTLFPKLGHNTAFANTSEPIDISIHWIKQKAMEIRNNKIKKTD